MRRALVFGVVLALAATPGLAQPVPPPAAPVSAAGQQRQADLRTQKALRRALGVLMQQYADLSGKLPDSLNDGDIAMREAVRALDSGDDAAAAAAIQRAIEALQKGGRAMSQQLAQQFGRGQGDKGDEGDEAGQGGDQDGPGSGPPDGRSDGGRQAAGRGGDRRDPLGRSLREDGAGQSPGEGGVRVPDQMEQARSRAIQEELRRREAEKTRPQPELDYIERLLQQF
jgi:hypothetical protein